MTGRASRRNCEGRSEVIGAASGIGDRHAGRTQRPVHRSCCTCATITPPNRWPPRWIADRWESAGPSSRRAPSNLGPGRAETGQLGRSTSRCNCRPPVLLRAIRDVTLAARHPTRTPTGYCGSGSTRRPQRARQGRPQTASRTPSISDPDPPGASTPPPTASTNSSPKQQHEPRCCTIHLTSRALSVRVTHVRACNERFRAGVPL